MIKPDDIPMDVWDAAWGVEAWARPHYSRGTTETAKIKVVEAIARAIMAAKAEVEAERDLLQDILDGRPAINAALPGSYIRWSQAIYSGDAARAAIRKGSE